MVYYFKLLLITTITLLLVAFCVANRHVITLSFFPIPYELSLPTYLFTIILFLLGYAVSSLFASIKRAKQSYALSKKERTITALQNEVSGLKQTALPPQKP